MNPASIVDLAHDPELVKAEKYSFCLVALHRVAPDLFSRAACATLSVIIDRTIAWGRDRAYISYREFREGAYGDRMRMSAGTGLSEETQRKAVKELVAKGWVKVVQGTAGKASSYEVLLSAIESALEAATVTMKNVLTNFVMSLKRPKKTTEKKDRKGLAVAKKKPRKTPLKTRGSNIEERSSSVNTKGKEIPRRPSSVREARKRVEQVRQKNRDKLRATSLSRNALADAWEVVRRSNPSTPALPVKARHALFGKQKKNWNPSDGPFIDFLDWVIRRWNITLSGSEFSWMDNTPSSPDPWFLVSFFERFLRVYRDSTEEDQLKESYGLTIAEYIRQGIPEPLARKLAALGPKTSKRLANLGELLTQLKESTRRLQVANEIGNRQERADAIAEARKNLAKAKKSQDRLLEGIDDDELTTLINTTFEDYDESDI